MKMSELIPLTNLILTEGGTVQVMTDGVTSMTSHVPVPTMTIADEEKP